ncbi:MAG: GxxExxY protein [Bacteroidaceae bacterium]|jgi:GxxExxY protein|nr:GxxExxY protein [Bacteroidaceae bacterium]MBR4405628.1 GxxExxY protein [Bacteroidaceae bacterium]MBR4855731.1 GxxExxY protein [Bacteroidaceae bacterium]MBR5482055.1 GxxExxY protein [Bacteroidaceae bacterium]MBR5607883.1 GxxExxY protein [Bacteroidaceae bacterium]
MELESLIKKVIQCVYNVRLQLSSGFLETVYQKALLIELSKQNIQAEAEVPVDVYYDDSVVGEYRADIVVEKKIILEIKAIQHLLPVHEAQLVNYLTATKIDCGLLINFGGERLEIKRKYRTYKKTLEK